MRILMTLAQVGIAATCLGGGIGMAQAQVQGTAGTATQQSGMTAGGAALGQATGPNGAMTGDAFDQGARASSRTGGADRRQQRTPNRRGAVERPLPTTTAHPVPRQPNANASAARRRLNEQTPLDTQPSNRAPTSDGAVNRFNTN